MALTEILQRRERFQQPDAETRDHAGQEADADEDHQLAHHALDCRQMPFHAREHRREPLDHESGDHSESQGAPPPGFLIDPALATSLGLDEETRRALLQSFGFRAVGQPDLQRWRWGGLKSADKRKRRKRGKRDAAPKQAATGERPRQPGKQAKRRHGNAGGKPPPPADPPRAPRPDRVPRRSPSPNSPFAGLAAMLAEAHKD